TASALFDDVIDERVTKLAASYAASIPALFAKLSEPPLVLSHADWRLDNLFFTPDGHVVAVDWQLIDRTVGPRDLAYFVSQSLAVEQPDDYKTAFRIYVDELRAHGVAVDEDWAWNMYRYGALLGFVYPIVAAGALTIEDPRHVELTRSMLVRSVAALHALDAFDLAL
ncbi:MAG TPA: phosphotransferase, partial [Acidimicrobiia bacterium]|nr:phosphotransferase [Acidimicrobiia bacterium]